MLRTILHQAKKLPLQPRLLTRFNHSDGNKDESQLREDLILTGIHLDDIDKIMSDDSPQPIDTYYPKLDVDKSQFRKPLTGHNLVVIQPWTIYANFDEHTDPELQLEECVSLGNTIHNWNVIGKKVVLSHHLNRKQLVGSKAFEDLKNLILSHKGVSAVMFGVELLSGVQLGTLEKGLGLPVYDRFTVVLNIFRQHARTREAKIQLALAELPYIRSHLREIHESSEHSSTAESVKILVGGAGESFYHRRLSILKKRESKLKQLLAEFKQQRDLTKKQRRKIDIPTVAIVGYTNCGKTSLIKFLTQDENLVPKDQLFATLDVTVHLGQLPSNKGVLYLDTVGFISRIPSLLVEAFSATLKDVQESDLVVHMLDVTHPDHRLQYATVNKALETLRIPKNLLESKLTVGNKADLISADALPDSLPKCDLFISATIGSNIDKLVSRIDQQLMTNLKHEITVVRVDNGGSKYSWLRKNATILECSPDETDGNYLICKVVMSPATSGKWLKLNSTKAS